MITRATPRQLEVLIFVRDYMAMPERTRGVRERLEDAGLVQNMYTEYGVWLITDAGLEVIAATERGRRALQC